MQSLLTISTLVRKLIVISRNANRTDQSRRLDDALWAYCIAFKTPIGMSHYQLVYGKSCDLALELEHKSMWVLKKLNLDWATASSQRGNDVNELDEYLLKICESLHLYKEKMKKYHDQRSKSMNFLWLIWCFYSILGCACFLASSSPSEPRHSL